MRISFFTAGKLIFRLPTYVDTQTLSHRVTPPATKLRRSSFVINFVSSSAGASQIGRAPLRFSTDRGSPEPQQQRLFRGFPSTQARVVQSQPLRLREAAVRSRGGGANTP